MKGTLIPNSRSLPATFIGRARIVVHWGVGHRHAPSQRGPFFPASCFDDYFGPTSRPRRYLFTPPRCMVGLELCCTRPARYTRSSRCGHREVGGVIPLQPWDLTAQKYAGLVSRPPPAGATAPGPSDSRKPRRAAITHQGCSTRQTTPYTYFLSTYMSVGRSRSQSGRTTLPTPCDGALPRFQPCP